MKRVVRAILPILVIAAGIGIAAMLFSTRPAAKRAERAALAPLVEAVALEPQPQKVQVVAMGTVVPAEEVELRAEVTGRVLSHSPSLVPGGRVKKGEVLIRIEPRAYELALEEREAAVERAEVELAMEKGRQRVAHREWKLIGQESNEAEGKALALREPQLKSAGASLLAAKSGLERAQLDVERTIIRAPFNAIVKDEAVDRGQLVMPQSRLGGLIGSDRFWVQVSVPVSQLGWIALPGIDAAEGSTARVIQDLGNGTIERSGRVVRLMGDLDPKGRMARLLVEIEDPLGDKAEKKGLPLLVGAYVRVEIEGKQLEQVFVVPRVAMRSEKDVWIVNAQNQLDIREVEIAWRGRDHVYLSAGIGPGDRLITSRLATPVSGMPVRVKGDAVELTNSGEVAP